MRGILSLLVVLTVTFLLFNPGFIILFAWTAIKLIIIVAIMNAVAKLIFKKPLWDLLKDNKGSTKEQ